MTQYGVFGQEGCLYVADTREEAEERAADLIAEGEPDVTVGELCPDHEEQPRVGCEECATDGEEEPVDDETEPVYTA